MLILCAGLGTTARSGAPAALGARAEPTSRAGVATAKHREIELDVRARDHPTAATAGRATWEISVGRPCASLIRPISETPHAGSP